MPEQILILGGVGAGMSAASRARRVNPAAAITVLEAGPVASYGACGLPYVISGEVAQARLIAHPPEFFRERRRLDLRLNHQALAIEPGRRRVRVRADGVESYIGYDRLVIAAGARPRWNPPPLRNVFGAHTWSDLEALQAALDGASGADRIRRIAVVGAGYIGLEMAAALAARHFQVTLVDAHASLLPAFEVGLTARLEAPLAAAGIEFRGGARVAGLRGAPGGRVLGLETGAGDIETDLVVNCGGLRPNAELAEGAGLTLGAHGAIAVDERQQTSQPGIYAAGDCAATRHLVGDQPAWIPLGAAANKQGRVAGQNAAGGEPARFPGILGTLAVPLFGFEIGRTGLTLAQARAAGYDAATETVTTAPAAGYFSGADLTLTLVHQPSTGRLLGAHFFGPAGTVGGRLDTAAVALSARMHLDQIEMLDLAYSPRLAPLYEPLLIAAHNARRR